MSKPHSVPLTVAEMTQLAKDAAICAAKVSSLRPGDVTPEILAASRRILKLLNLEN